MPTLLETGGSLASKVHICWEHGVLFWYGYSVDITLRFMMEWNTNKSDSEMDIHLWMVFWSWLEWGNKNVLQLVRDITIRLLEPELRRLPTLTPSCSNNSPFDVSKLLSLTQPRVQYLFRSNISFYAGHGKDYKVILSNLYRLGMLYAKIINYCIFNIHQRKELLQDNLLR